MVLGAMGAMLKIRPDGPDASPPLDAAADAGSPDACPALAMAVPDGMALISEGTFMMGSDDGLPSEKPVHSESVCAFYMDKTEVTVAAYGACVRAGRCAPAALSVDWPNITDKDRATWNPYCNGDRADRQNHPVNCVDWHQAKKYCEWANKRLPTEEEWEYAARGTDGHKYPWGKDEPGAQLCWNGNGNDLGKGKRNSTCEVGKYPAGLFGLKDMAGNVWEWTSSEWPDNYDAGRTDASRANRGGGWIYADPSNVRGALRNWVAPSARYCDLGFRCSRAP